MIKQFNPSGRKRWHRWQRAGVVVMALAGQVVWASDDVTAQTVDTKNLPPLGEAWKAENPYRKNAVAIKVGTSAYNQNCARCHGLDAISSGIAPDLRKLDNDCATLKDTKKKAACVKEIDESYVSSVRRGKLCG